MSTFEVWITPEQNELLKEIYDAGKASNAAPYGPRITRSDGKVLISYETDEYEEAAIEAIWKHRDKFGWTTREDMKIDILLMGTKMFLH